MKILSCFLFFIILSSCSQLTSYRKTSAQFSGYGSFLFGYELSFTDLDLVEKESEHKNLFQKLKNDLNRVFGSFKERLQNSEGASVKYENALDIIYINVSKDKIVLDEDLIIKISIDEYVYEVTFNKMKLSHLLELEDFFEQNIFKTFQELGYEPHKSLEGGHINLDIDSIFGDNYIHFRNFIVDMINNEFLAAGLFRPLYPSYKRLKYMSNRKEDNVKNIIDKADKRFFNNPKAMTADNFIQKISGKIGKDFGFMV